MRNRIAPGYFELDLDIVLDTVKHALPEPIAFLEPIPAQLLRQEPESASPRPEVRQAAARRLASSRGCL